MKSLLSFTAGIVFLSLVAFFVFNFIQNKLSPRIGQLSVNVSNQRAQVFLDDKLIGTTQLYRKDLPLGDHRITIKPEQSGSDGFSWNTTTTLTKSTVSTIDLDLAPNLLFSAGESLYFQPGNKTVSILSRPEKATVIVDKKVMGTTPLKVSWEKGVHQITLKKEGYLDRVIPLNIEEGYKLSAVVYLALNPFEKITKLASNDKISLFAITTSHSDLSKNTSSWVQGVGFIQKNFNGVETKFDVLIDEKGKVYVLNQTEWENKKQTKSVSTVGYLTKTGQTGLSEAANTAWQQLKTLFD